MKTKNRYNRLFAYGVIITSCISVFTSCVKEEFDCPDKGEETTFDIVLSTADIQTKAANGYDYASDEELTVGSAAVAVFDKESGKRVGYKYFSSPTDTQYESKKAYSLSGLKSKVGTLYICVVANPTLSDAALNALSTYSNFTAQSTTAASNTFSPSSLVKFGIKEAIISANTAEPIVVPLTQVAAKVKMKYIVTTDQSGWTTSIGTNTINGIFNTSKTFLNDYTSSGYVYNGSNAVSITGNVNNNQEIAFYTYEKNTAINFSVPISVFGGVLTQNKTYSYNLLPVEGGDCKTNGFVHGNYYDVGGNIHIDVKLNCTINWEVKSFAPVTVTIPDFQ